jgi:hypothetical protein
MEVGHAVAQLVEALQVASFIPDGIIGTEMSTEGVKAAVA